MRISMFILQSDSNILGMNYSLDLIFALFHSIYCMKNILTNVKLVDFQTFAKANVSSQIHFVAFNDIIYI